jgi:1-acyl-sn-glycerol-3-phosphate acyltransferase
VEKERIPFHGPAVFISNHLDSYAPVAVLSAFPLRLYPWVAYQIMDRKLCPGYLRMDFVEPELRLSPPLSRLTAWIISKACVAIMKALGAIPVYERSMKLASTWKQSLHLLARDRCLIIFPERDHRPLNSVLNELDDGFIGLALTYYRKTGRVLKFIPVAVDREAKAIHIAPPVFFIPERPFSLEKDRIKAALQDLITEMLTSPKIHEEFTNSADL